MQKLCNPEFFGYITSAKKIIPRFFEKKFLELTSEMRTLANVFLNPAAWQQLKIERTEGVLALDWFEQSQDWHILE